MQRLCPRFPLAPGSHPIGTHVLAAGAAAGRAWETVGRGVRIQPPPSPAHGVKISPSRGEAVGHGAWWGRGPQGWEVGVSPLGVCSALTMGAPRLRPHGCHLPRCLVAVAGPGLGLTVPHGASSVERGSGLDVSHRARAAQHTLDAAQGGFKGPATLPCFS